MFAKIKFALRCALRMEYRELFATVSKVHKITKKNRLSVLIDIVLCGFKYSAGFNDYLLCEFYNLNDEQRATYVTRGVNNKLVSMLNDREYYHFFDNKSHFYNTFGDLLGRRWLNFADAEKDEFKAFISGLDRIMVKPDAESGGKGVEKINISDFPDTDILYDKLKSDNIGVIEEVIVQSEKMSKLNPSCLNTLRITTIVNDEGPHIVYAFVRIGNSDRPVDNLHSGGMFAPIGIDSGIIEYPGYDKERMTYDVHPKTGTPIVGFEIPFWEESKALCLSAALRVPQMKYVGWDVGITDKGPIFVEGNNLPGYDILQMPPHTPDRMGMLPTFRKYVKGI